MNFSNLQITSASALDLDFTVTAPVYVLRGRDSDPALDLIRELIGDYGAQYAPHRVDDSRFVIHTDIEMGTKRGADNTNVLIKTADISSYADDRPIFIYGYFDCLDKAIDIAPILDKLSSLGRQVFISVCSSYPTQKMKHNHVQVVQL